MVLEVGGMNSGCCFCGCGDDGCGDGGCGTVGAEIVDAAGTLGVVIVGAGSTGMVAGTVVMDTVVASCEMAWQLVQVLLLPKKCQT